MTEQGRHIYGPVVVDPRKQPDGTIKFEVWDNNWFQHWKIDTFDTQAKADAAAKKLRK